MNDTFKREEWGYSVWRSGKQVGAAVGCFPHSLAHFKSFPQDWLFKVGCEFTLEEVMDYN